MPALTLESLKVDGSLKVVAVPVPEFGSGTEAWLCELSMNERDDRLELGWAGYKKSVGKTDNAGLSSWIVASCLCTGPEREFLCKTGEDLAAMAAELGKHGNATSRLYAKAMELNGIGQTEAAELEKN